MPPIDKPIVLIGLAVWLAPLWGRRVLAFLRDLKAFRAGR
jgi:hypothetical protein